jgi:hypothetical protein
MYEAAAALTITPSPDVVTRVFMLFHGIEHEDSSSREIWQEALNRSSENVSFWKAVIGLDEEKALDRDLFRVLEWGGMEVC